MKMKVFSSPQQSTTMYKSQTCYDNTKMWRHNNSEGKAAAPGDGEHYGFTEHLETMIKH